MKLAKYSTKFSKKQIILLSIPVFFSNLAIPMVGIVDTGLMGNLGETKYLAATSIATSVMTMVIWSFGFLRMGTVGIVSQAYGRGDYREIVKTLLRNFLPITIGSNSGCFILAGMIALPDAISFLTNSAVTLFSESVKLFSLAAANSISLVIIPFFAYVSWVTLSLNL